MTAKISTALLSVLLLASCSSKLSPPEYQKWFQKEENRVLAKTEAGELEYILEYRPSELMALQQLGKDYSTEKFKNVLEDYKSFDYYILKIRNKKQNIDVIKNGLPNALFAERLRFYAEDFGSNFIQVQSTDTLYPAFSHLERTYNVSPFTTVLTSFEKNETAYNEIIFNDLPNNNLVRFEIDKEKIDDLPELAY